MFVPAMGFDILELKSESEKGQKRSKQAPKVSSAPGGKADMICPNLRLSFSTVHSQKATLRARLFEQVLSLWQSRGAQICEDTLGLCLVLIEH